MSSEGTDKRFMLEGEGQEKRQSHFIAQEQEKSRRKPRVLIGFLATLAFILFIWSSISQFKLSTQQKQINQINNLVSKTEKSKIALDAKQQQIDSLQNIILKLQNKNDLLAEVSSIPNGIFFEVQLGDFRDFDLDKYLSNLASINQYKYNGGNKLLLGRFRSFKKALLFEGDLKRMGITNAVVVGRIDNKIVSYQEALNAQQESNKID